MNINYKVTFNMDGRGVFIDFNEPIHLDSMVGSLIAKEQNLPILASRDEVPAIINYPFCKSKILGHNVYHASAILPETELLGETIRHWRKKFRANKMELTKGSPNLTMGINHEFNQAVPITLVTKLYAYFSCTKAQKEETIKLVKQIKAIGKKCAYGYGRVISVDIEEIKEDYSLVKDGKAMRWLPKKDGIRILRTTPPYWNILDTTTVCEIGEEYLL